MTTFPLGLNKIRSVNVDTDINVISNVEAISGKKEVVLGDIVKQTIQLNTTPLTETEDRQFQVFLKQIKNYGLIELSLSNLSVFKPTIISTDSLTVTTTNAIGSKLIITNNPTTYPLTVGSYIQFNNVDTIGPKKLHQVVNIANTSSTTKTIEVSPGLDTAIAIDTKINYNNLIGQFRADNGAFSSQSGTLLNDGTTTKTYRFRLTEEL